MRVGYPIKIIFKKECFVTLYFDDVDELLVRNKNIICYNSEKELIDSEKSIYEIDDSLVVYDFTKINYENPVDYKEVLDKWNLLDTIAKMYNMYFEGNQKNKTYTYKYLFSCVFSIDELPKYYKLPKKCLLDINKVFKKTGRYMSKLVKQ